MPNEMALTSTQADLHRQPDFSPHQSPAAALAAAATVRSPHELEVNMYPTSLSVAEAVDYIGISESSFRRRAKRHGLEATRCSTDHRRRMYKIKDLDRLMAIIFWQPPKSQFEPVAAEEMRAAGWAMDERRGHDGRLYGASPIRVVCGREAA